MKQKILGNKIYFLLTLPSVAVFVLLYFYRGHPYTDDPYIFYRYASNWAMGYGPVFNVGEYVEGFSSFLWTAVLALMSLSGIDLVRFAPHLNLVLSICSLFMITYICSCIRFTNYRFMSLLLTLFCALTYGFYFYTAVGMDTIIFLFSMLVALIGIHTSYTNRNFLLLVPFLFLLNIVRAEGFLYSIALLSVLSFFTYKDIGKIPRKLLYAIAVFAGLTVLQFAVRYSIYNEFMPATVSAKGYASYSLKKAVIELDFQSLINFLKVIYSGLIYEFQLFYLAAWLPIIVLIWKRDRIDKNYFFILLMMTAIAVNVFVTLMAGGDPFPFKRHLVPVIPMLLVSFAWSVDVLVREYWNGSNYRKASLTLILLIIALTWSYSFMKPNVNPDYFLDPERPAYEKEMGLLIRDVPASTIFLTNMAGKMPYYAGPNVYVRDILGLTDLYNAKHGDVWAFSGGGSGVCGRTDYNYCFTTPFDILHYNSINIHRRIIAYCLENSPVCDNYRFFKYDNWKRKGINIIANIDHPVSAAIIEKLGAVPLPIDEELLKYYD